jgi:hypothetical protein
MEEWLLPWKERGSSDPVNDSFLWRSDCLYVMDNHRLALWCWWQHLNSETRSFDFLHIDRHYDTLWLEACPWRNHYEPAHRSDLESFRQAKFIEQNEEFHLYRWDVIASALFILDGEKIRNWAFTSPAEGDAPPIPYMQCISPENLPALLKRMAQPNDHECLSIIDIDLDYFTRLNKENGSSTKVFSDKYMHELNSALVEGLSNSRFGVVTVALSPTTTGSWQLAEELCWALLDGLPSLPALRAGAP